jgi:hypothetical protein
MFLAAGGSWDPWIPQDDTSPRTRLVALVVGAAADAGL